MDGHLAGATPLDRFQRSTRNVRRTAGTSRHKGIRLSSSPPTAWYTSARAADGAADRRIGSPQLPGHDRLCGTIRSIDLAEPAALPTSTRSVHPVNSLRVLWLSPWIRPLARVQAEALRRRGVDVCWLPPTNTRNRTRPVTTSRCLIRASARHQIGRPRWRPCVASASNGPTS